VKHVFITALCLASVAGISGQEKAPALFEPKQVVQDIDFLLESLKSIHPTFGRNLTDSSFAGRIDSVKKAIRRPLSRHDFFKIMQPLVSVDGHTSLRFDDTIYPEVDAPFFPFKVLLVDNKLYVKENLSSDTSVQKGAVVDSINGLPVSAIVRQLTEYVPRDGSRLRPYKLANEFHHYYRLVFGNFAEFRLTVDDKGSKHALRVPGARAESFGFEQRPQFEFRMLRDSVAYFYIGKFRKPDLFMACLDSVFTILHEEKPAHLIIDKRSGGGFTNLADSLLSYLTDKPFRTFEKKMVKISPANTDYVEENKSKGTVRDGYLVIDYPEVVPPKRENRFRGTTYVLMDHQTYSTATYFVAAVKCSNVATLVGEEAAQPLISNADLHGFRLPNTQMKCYSSMSTYYFPCAKNRKDSVAPDHEVRYTIDELLDGSDRCLEYALALIEGR
jgi:hypothetical protein